MKRAHPIPLAPVVCFGHIDKGTLIDLLFDSTMDVPAPGRGELGLERAPSLLLACGSSCLRFALDMLTIGKLDRSSLCSYTMDRCTCVMVSAPHAFLLVPCFRQV